MARPRRGNSFEGTAAPSTDSFAPIPRQVVTMQAIDLIKGMILHGDLQPFQALPPERQLSVQLGVSRPTLREAIRALTVMNILEARHGDGTYVTSLDPVLLSEPIRFVLQVNVASILALFEVRKVLEANAAAIAAARMTDDEIADLMRLVKASGELTDINSLIECDISIHSSIIAGTHNPLYMSLTSTVSQLSRESRRLTADLPALKGKAHRDHEAICRCLKRRDADGARAAMTMHLDTVEKAYRAAS